MATEQEFEFERHAGVAEDGNDLANDVQETGQPPVNLDDLPQFRDWKSKMDKQIGSIANETKREREARLALEDELRSIRMSGMDEPERLAYEREEAIRMNQRLVSELKKRDMLEQKRKDLAHIARKVGISYDELESAIDDSDTVHEAWDKAFDIRESKARQRPARDEDEEPTPRRSTQEQSPAVPKPRPSDRPANLVDSGRGTSPSVGNRYQKAYDRAKENNDLFAMYDAIADADRAGVTLDRDK